jgi:peroxiredoxin
MKKMKTRTTIVILLFLYCQLTAQTITGNLSQLAKQEIKVEGFNGLETYSIAKTTLDEKGNFSVSYTKEDKGIGYLTSADNKPLFVILSGEDITLQGETLRFLETIKITKGVENKAFETYAKNHPKREQALSAWVYLENLYRTDSLFSIQKSPSQAIQKEKKRIHQEDAAFLASLPKDSYVKWFLPIRKLVSSVSAVAQYRPKEIPATLAALRNINYADARLYKSGLLKEAIENHIWFIENSSGALDAVFKDLNSSIDIIIEQLKEDNEKFNLIATTMFEVLEERSLFTSAEYLAKKLLEDEDCGCLNPDFEKRMQKYGKMAEGSTAPDIALGEATYYPEGVTARKLSEVKSDYTLVVFAAGWCPHCTEELPKIANYYPTLKQKNVEVILVSLDENASNFAKFAAPFPFISTTDYKKWGGQAATDYQVYATPSYFLLDKDLKIVKRLNSVEHLKAVVDNKIK